MPERAAAKAERSEGGAAANTWPSVCFRGEPSRYSFARSRSIPRMARSNRFTSPLPAATALAVAMLVAMAAILADANVRDVASESSAAGRMPSSLVLPSRALASVLASVAERLEEDWSGARRPHSPRATHLSGSGWRWTWSRLHGLRSDALIGADFGSAMAVADGTPGGPWRRALPFDEIAAGDARQATHRHTLNLPPPANA